jgi:hypothetical protein
VYPSATRGDGVAAIFSRSTDSRVRQAVVGVIVGLGLFVVGWYYYALPSYTRVGYRPQQPVPFSHEQHVGQLGIDCTYCHSQVFDSPHANVPTSQTCMNCHNKEKANVKGNSPYLQPVYNSFKSGLPVEWKRVHKLPEYAYFNHAVHVNKGVSCVSCHGRVNEMKVVVHDQVLSMGWCLRCHNEPAPSLRPVTEVTNLTWAPAGSRTRDEIGREIKKDLQVNPPMHCQSCHR